MTHKMKFLLLYSFTVLQLFTFPSLLRHDQNERERGLESGACPSDDAAFIRFAGVTCFFGDS